MTHDDRTQDETQRSTEPAERPPAERPDPSLDFFLPDPYDGWGPIRRRRSDEPA